MKIVGMKQLRQKFDPIRKGLESGEEYLLMYRSKPLAVLRPYQAGEDSQHLQKPQAGAQPSTTPKPSTTSATFTKPIMEKAREIVAPKMTYSDVINDYQVRKTNGQTPKPTQATKTTPITKTKSATPQKTINPLNRLGIRRAFT